MRTNQRKALRLPNYDYSRAGAYFVTLVAKDRRHLFGEMVGQEMQVNRLGCTVRDVWHDLPNHYAHVATDTFIVMPNHIHGIIIIHDLSVRAIHESPLQHSPIERRRMLLPKIIGRLKTVSAKRINEMRHTPSVPVWQRGYYDHVIRSETDLNDTRHYIHSNPLRWHLDEENLPL